MPYKIQIPAISQLLDKVPQEDRPKEDGEFWDALGREIDQLFKYALQAKEPQVVLNEMRKAGEQYIWEFYVNDLAKPREASYNWHGQNVSQWQYAGAILLQNGEVSTHH